MKIMHSVSKFTAALLLTSALHTFSFSATEQEDSIETTQIVKQHKRINVITKDDVPEYAALAESGDSNAAYELMRYYGSVRNLNEMNTWAHYVEKNGDEKIWYKVGSFFAYNTNQSIQSDKRAAEFFAFAAGCEYPKALYALALCYRKGAGVSRSFSTALDLYMRAAALNEPKSLYALGEIHKNRSEDGQALSYFKRSSDLNDPWGQYGLALCYLEDIGGEGEQAEALRLLELSAEPRTLSPNDLGNIRAKILLGDYYRRAYTTEALSIQQLFTEQMDSEIETSAAIIERINQNNALYRLSVGWYASAENDPEAAFKRHEFKLIKLYAPQKAVSVDAARTIVPHFLDSIIVSCRKLCVNFNFRYVILNGTLFILFA